MDNIAPPQRQATIQPPPKASGHKSDFREQTLSVALHSTGDKSLIQKGYLLNISRSPVVCPIPQCGRTIGLTSVLSHYLCDHSEDLGIQCQETYIGKRSLLIFDPSALEFRASGCLGVLAYGGSDKGADNGCTTQQSAIRRPAERGLCLANAFLPQPYEHLDSHLPLLIMACRTSWTAMLADKKFEAAQLRKEADNVGHHLLVVWLASVQTTKPIFATVTLYDKLMTASRSCIIKVRSLNKSQNPSEFLHRDSNYLRLSQGEVDILSQHGSECVQLEIMINEDE